LPDTRALQRWLPVLGWAALISIFSTGWFSNEHTGRILIPLLHSVFPTLSALELQAIHRGVRKASHITEYFVLSLLIHRQLRRDGWGAATSAAVSLALSVTYAVIDEFHQLFVPGRTAAWKDVGFDTLGAVAAQLLLLALARPQTVPASARS
jgi:VanZ family protein